MGRKTSGGCLLCADRSGAETARRPGDVCSATTEAERRPWTHGACSTTTVVLRKMGRVRSGGPHATSRPSRRRDLEPWCSCPTTTEVLRKMGCKTSGGRLFCNDRSGAETLDPWGQGPLPLLKLKRAKP